MAKSPVKRFKKGRPARCAYKLRFARGLRMRFNGRRYSTDCGLAIVREVFDALGLDDLFKDALADIESGRKVTHRKAMLLVQALFSRIAGYWDQNDADFLADDPAMRLIVGGQAAESGGHAAKRSRMQSFETVDLASDEVFGKLRALVGRMVERVYDIRPVKEETITVDGTLVEVSGKQEGSERNPRRGGNRCLSVLKANNRFGDIEGCELRPGNTNDHNGCKELLMPIFERYGERGVDITLAGDAAFGSGEIYDYVEEQGGSYVIRQKNNPALQRIAAPLLERPNNLKPGEVGHTYVEAEYKAGDWKKKRRVVFKVTWEEGNWVPLDVAPIITNVDWSAEEVCDFYDNRAVQEQWIKEAKNAIGMKRLSCTEFRSNEVRVQLHALAYNILNFLRTLVLPGDIAHWTLTTIREKLVKIGGRIVHHANERILDVAEVAITEDRFQRIMILVGEVRRRYAEVFGERPRRRYVTA